MEQQSQSSDEINLYDLWIIIAKRKKFLIALFLVGVISSAVASALMPKIYRGEALLNILQHEEGGQVKEIIQAKEIADMIGTVDAEKRARFFPGTSASVTYIELKPIKDSKDKLLVAIEAKNADLIGKALSEVVDYINNFEIVKMIVKEEKEKLLQRSGELSNIINSSANLSDTYRKLLNQGKLFPVGFNPVDLTKKIADIKLEKLSVDQSVQRFNNGAIEIAKQLYIQNKPVKPKIGRNVALGGAMSIFAGIFLVCLENYFKKMKGTGV